MESLRQLIFGRGYATPEPQPARSSNDLRRRQSSQRQMPGRHGVLSAHMMMPAEDLPSQTDLADDEPLVGAADAQPAALSTQPKETEPLSSGALRLSAKVEYASLPRDAAHTVFSLVSLSSEVRAPATTEAIAAATEEAPPRTAMDVVCVLDVSGSMSGEKIELLKEAMGFVVDELNDHDRLSITSFNSAGQRLSRLGRMGQEGREAAKRATGRLTAGGGTSIAAGLELGLRTLEQRRHKNPVAAVFLLTDGQDYGCRQHLEALVRRCRACGAALYAFGFGADHDAKLLGAFAENAQTPFTFVEAPPAISAAFAGALSGLMSVVAQRAQVRIETAPGATLEKVHTVFAASPLADGAAGALVEIPDLFAGERKDLLVELKVPQLPEGAAPQTDTLLRASVRYYDMEQKAMVATGAVTLELGRSPAAEQPEVEPDEEVSDQRHRVQATNAMETALSSADRGDFESAQQGLAGCRKQLAESVAKRKDKRKSRMTEALEAELEDAERRVSSASSFQQGGHAEMLDAMQMHRQQRCTNVTVNTSVSVDTRSRKRASKGMYIQAQQMACIAKTSQ